MSHDKSTGHGAPAQNKPVAPASTVKAPETKGAPADKKVGANPVKNDGRNKK